MSQDNKKLAEILHTIFCERSHESDMNLFEKTSKCMYYLENNINLTWELPAHQEWLMQAEVLKKISHPLDISEVIQDMIKIYQISEQFKKVNQKLLSYVKILIS